MSRTSELLRDTAKKLRAWDKSLSRLVDNDEGMLIRKAFDRQARLLDSEARTLELGESGETESEART